MEEELKKVSKKTSKVLKNRWRCKENEEEDEQYSLIWNGFVKEEKEKKMGIYRKTEVYWTSISKFNPKWRSVSSKLLQNLPLETLNHAKICSVDSCPGKSASQHHLYLGKYKAMIKNGKRLFAFMRRQLLCWEPIN